MLSHTALYVLFTLFTGIYQAPRASLVAQMVKICLNVGDPGFIPGSGRSPGEGHGNPLQYSCLENSMDREAWWAYRPWGCKESDKTEKLALSLSHFQSVKS